MTDQPLEPDEAAPREPQPPPEPKPEPEPAAAEEPPRASPEPPPAQRRLFRTSDDRVIAGVCGGLGKYLGVDPVLIRIAAVLLVFAGGAGILLYVIGWIAIPEEPEIDVTTGMPVPADEISERTSGAVLLGFTFVVLGVFFLLDELWPDFLSWKYVWPIALIAVGLAVLVRGRR